ncbi:MAG: DUF3866 family protein [Clostridia bacterium]|nr:DUF3866 family protein [Clostridia bacterium]
MISKKIGVVLEILSHRGDLSELDVDIGGGSHPAVNIKSMTGVVSVGDKVLLNTTAQDLGLGSGGHHFVMANLSKGCHGDERLSRDEGHIMKLRYTPSQMRVMSVEEEASPHHGPMKQAESLNNIPVVCCTLHSMVPAAAASINMLGSGLRTIYIMTDGAALPLKLSRLIDTMERKGLIHGTITIGHAFGGDLEAVNIYSGLLAAADVLKADVVIVSMGPGIVGTGTTFGFTGLEQGDIINAVNVLGGRPIAVPRISFSDKRERHRGLSHHSITVLGRVALSPALISLPHLEKEKEKIISEQMQGASIFKKHRVVVENGEGGLRFLKKLGVKVTTMGRSLDQDREFFLASSSAGAAAAKMALGYDLQIYEGEDRLET